MARSLMDTIRERGIRTPSGEEPGSEERPSLVDSIVSGALVSLLYGVDVSPRDGDDLSRQSQALGSNRNSLYSLIADIKRTLESRGGDETSAATIVDFVPDTHTKIDNMARSLTHLDNIDDKLQIIENLLSGIVVSSRSSSTDAPQQIEILLRGQGVDGLNNLLESLKQFTLDRDNQAAVRQLENLSDVANVVNMLGNVRVNRSAQDNVNKLNDIIGVLAKIKLPRSSNDDQARAQAFGNRIGYLIKALKDALSSSDFQSLATTINTIEGIGSDNSRDGAKGIGMVVSFLSVLSSFIDNANVIGTKKVNKGFSKVLLGMSNEIVKSLAKAAKNMADNKDNIAVVSTMFTSYASFVDSVLKIADRSLVSLLLLRIKLKLSSDVFNKAFLELVRGMSDVSASMRSINVVGREEFRQQIRNIKETYSQFNDTIEEIGEAISITSMLKTMLKLKAARKTVDSVNKLLTEMFTVSIPPITAMQERLDYYIELATGLGLVFDELRLVNDSGIGRLDKSIKNLVGAVKGLEALDKVVGKKTGKNVGRFIRGFMHTLSTIDDAAINKAKESTIVFAAVVGVAVAALLAVSAASMLISWKSIIAFAVGLPLFIKGVSKAAAKMNGVEIDPESLNAFMGFVIGSTWVMLIGSLFMELIDLNSIKSFVVSMLLFTTGLTGIYYLISKVADDESEKKVMSFYMMVASSGAVMMLGSYFMRYIQLEDIGKFIGGMALFVGGMTYAFYLVNKVVKDENVLQNAMQFSILVAVSGAIMVAGAMVSKLIDFWGLVTFTASLSVFMFAVCSAYKMLYKAIGKETITIAQDFMILVALSGTILIAGAMVSKLIDPIGLITFTASLALFLLGVGSIYKMLSKTMGENPVTIAKDFIILIAVSGTILLLGGMLMNVIDKMALVTFTVTLGLFLLGVGLVYKIMGSVVGDALKHARDFTILIAVSGALLLAGGAILELMGPKGIAHVILFGVLLWGFIWGITKIYKKNATNIGVAFSVAAGFALLVAVSGAVLLAGGAILELMGLKGIGYTIAFGVLLLGFVGGLTWIYKQNATNIAMSIPTALALGLLVAISAATLLIGGKFIADDKDMWWAVPEFAAITVLFVGCMSAVMFLLSQIKGNLVQGGLAMLAIAGITWLMGKALQEVALVARIASADEIKDVMLMGGLVIAGVTAIAAALGALVTSGVGALLLGAGAVALAGVIGFVFAISEMVRNIAVTATILNNAPEIDFDKVNGLVKGMFGIAASMVKNAPWTLMVKAKFVSSTIMDLIGSLGPVAQVVKDFADLKIPVYNGTKLAGYVTIGDETFATVASNIEKIITAVTRPLVDTIKNNPDLFGTGDFFSNPFVDTPAVNAAKMVGHVGNSLGKVAQGVKDLAELKIPVYKGTTLTGYIALGNETFQKVATNVKSLILAVAEPIVSTIKDHAELFGGGSWFTETPAENAAKMVGKVGSSLGKVAEGVKDLSELKIPVYNGTTVTGYIALGNETFSKVSDNVRSIILAVAEPIVSTIKDNPDLFKEGTFNDSPAVNAAKAVGEIGKALTPLAMGVQFWSMLKVPVYEGEKIKEYITLGDDQFAQVAINIKRVVEAVGGALVNTVKDSTFIFGSWNGGIVSADAPALNASKAILLVSNSLSPIAQCLAYYASGKFPIITGYDANGKPIIDLSTTLSQDTMKVAQQNIKDVLTAILDVLKDVQGDFGGDWFGSGSDVERASKAVTEVANSLKTMVDVVGNMSKTDFATVNAQVNKTQQNIKTLLGGIVGIIGLFSAEKTHKNADGTTEADHGWFASLWSGNGLETSIAEYITNESKDLKKAIDGIVDASKELNKLYTSVSTLQDTITSNKKNTDAFIRKITVNGSKEQQYAIVNSLMAITTVFSAVVDNVDKKELSSNASDIKSIANDVDTFTDGFGDILKSLTKTMQSTNSFVSVDRSALGNLQAVLNEYKNSMLKMVTVFKGIGSASMRDIADTTMYQDRAFNLLIRTAQNASNAGGNGYSILAKGILEIAEAEAQLGQNQTFAQHAAIMERYVQTINAVKVGNLDRLNSFAISLNNLAEKLGNVDKLTHALAVQLTGVLNRLVKEIERAEKTINNADKMQVRRFDMIKKSVKDVQKIMDKKLVVEVNQGMAADATLEGGGTDFGGTSTSNTTMNVSAPSGSNADTPTTQQKHTKKNGSIGLTELNEALSANNDVLVRKLKGRK